MRALLVLCLAVALGALWLAATRHLRELTASLQRAAERELRTDLRDRARRVADQLETLLAQTPVEATYSAGGRLLRPAPPGEARRWTPPFGTAATAFLRDGKPGEALAAAETSAERAAAQVALGEQHGDLAALQAALREEALQGTDLALWVRLRLGEADLADDASALLGGPSHRLGEALLSALGAQPLLDRATRARLAALHPSPGVTLEPDAVIVTSTSGDTLTRKRIPAASLDLGAGPVAEPLPAPFAALAVRGWPPPVDARRQSRLLIGLYALAGLLLSLGTVYAWTATARALRLARAKSDFVANVTHELKTPLANIRLYAESLRDGRVREGERPEFLETILGESARLETLVQGLLDAARGPRLRREPLRPRDLITEAEARWRPRLEREGFVLTVSAPDLPPVSADREALLRALGNLLDNARKYGRADPRILLSGEASNGTVRLLVVDHGPGIPVGERGRVLKPFTRLESADRKETPGTGLGLSLAAACMEAHGGRVEIGGGAGEGARVALVLPAEKA